MAAFTAPDVTAAETLTFRLTVEDAAGAQASDEVQVTVQPVEQDFSGSQRARVRGAVRVVGAGGPLNCGAVTVCQGAFDAGSEVVLEAVARIGWRHEGWWGCDETGERSVHDIHGRRPVCIGDLCGGRATGRGRGIPAAHIRTHRADEVRDLSRSGRRVGKYAAGVRARYGHTGPRGALNLQTFQDLSGCGG